jgi:hypothetical protein
VIVGPDVLQTWAPIVGGLAGGLGVLVALLGLVWQQARLIRSQQRETYMRLELASIEVFRFEAANAAILGYYQGLVDPGGQRTEVADTVALNHYYQTLNLFEIIVRLTRAKEVDHEIFGSWVIWQHDLLCQWYFRDCWPQLRQNYTSELRAIFDRPVGQFDPGQDGEVRKMEFFHHVAATTNIPTVKKWLDS